ncbi:unnamed protein product, partial [Didymodactylos carnosus]
MSARTVWQLLPHLDPECTFHNVYGPAETTVATTYHFVTLEDLQKESIPIGHPLVGYQCYILDEYLQPVPPLATAELYVGGLGVFSGYFNRDDLTKQVLIDIPGVVDGKCYKTGDLVKLDSNGELYFV